MFEEAVSAGDGESSVAGAMDSVRLLCAIRATSLDVN